VRVSWVHRRRGPDAVPREDEAPVRPLGERDDGGAVAPVARVDPRLGRDEHALGGHLLVAVEPRERRGPERPRLLGVVPGRLLRLAGGVRPEHDQAVGLVALQLGVRPRAGEPASSSKLSPANPA
jgi:hypothetical protein